MRILASENRDGVRRYAHVSPGGRGAARCATGCPGTRHTCTRERGHGGPHVAHGTFRRVLAVWDGGRARRTPVAPAERSTERRPERRRRKEGPVGLRRDSPAGPLAALRHLAVRVLKSPEQLVFLVLFVAFVGFAVHWFSLILG